jgi:serine/threonine-protein kinase
VESLDHPHILPTYESGSAGDLLYIAMKRIQGTDLAHLIRDQAMPTDRAVRFLAQAAAGLDAAHEAGLVHRDVKPQNMLVSSDDAQDREHLWLSDFGLTKESASDSSLTSTGRLMGTVHYVSPEVLQGEAVDGRADVYSLGCVLYECLTGQVVFERNNDLAEMWAHVQEAPVPPSRLRPDLPAAIDDVIATALEKAPANRFLACSELMDAVAGSFDSAPAASFLPLRATQQLEATRKRREQEIPDLWSARRAALARPELSWKKVGALAVAGALIASVALWGPRTRTPQVAATLGSSASGEASDFAGSPRSPGGSAKRLAGAGKKAGPDHASANTETGGAVAATAAMLTGGTEEMLALPPSRGAPTFDPSRRAFLDPGQMIVFTRDGNNQVEPYLLRPDGTQEKFIDDAGPASDAQISPDGTRVAWASMKSGNPDIWVMDIDGGDPVNLTKSPFHDADAAWSPDGKRITFASNREGDMEIYAMNADGPSLPTRLSFHLGHDGFPAWSPDGTKIAYHSDLGTNWDIMTVRPDGTGTTNVSRNPSTHEIFPAWSPDGTRIAFTTVREGNFEVFVMDQNGDDERNLTNDPAIDDMPTWSPDGLWIAFNSNRDGDNDIYSMTAAGRKQRPLTRNSTNDTGAQWVTLTPSGTADQGSTGSSGTSFL